MIQKSILKTLVFVMLLIVMSCREKTDTNAAKTEVQLAIDQWCKQIDEKIAQKLLHKVETSAFDSAIVLEGFYENNKIQKINCSGESTSYCTYFKNDSVIAYYRAISENGKQISFFYYFLNNQIIRGCENNLDLDDSLKIKIKTKNVLANINGDLKKLNKKIADISELAYLQTFVGRKPIEILKDKTFEARLHKLFFSEQDYADFVADFKSSKEPIKKQENYLLITSKIVYNAIKYETIVVVDLQSNLISAANFSSDRKISQRLCEGLMPEILSKWLDERK